MIEKIMVVAARAYQRLGATGLLGFALLSAASVTYLAAWQRHRQDSTAVVPPASTDNAVILPAATPGRLAFPASSDIPLLLSRIQRAAVKQGLGWPRADYRINAATADSSATFEVHCTLKGPYPAVRGFVTALLQDTPALTLREFSLSRSSTDVPEVEAKLSILIHLASEGHR
ncbi:MAG: hypothetical protein HY020_06995 [Burkholderiales bacterium]|nr:hypothetical protein [Burkholderiales bacterium]